MIIRTLKLFYWAIRKKSGRYQLLQAFVKDIPGLYGREIRNRLYKKHFGSCGTDVVIHMDARIRNIDKLHMGDRARIGECVMIQAGGVIEVGEDVLIGPGAKIWSANHKFEDLHTPIQDQDFECKKVTIGNGCWIGANAFIMPGVTLGEGCIVSAGAIVGAKEYPAYKIIAGNPARVIGARTEITPESKA